MTQVSCQQRGKLQVVVPERQTQVKSAVQEVHQGSAPVQWSVKKEGCAEGILQLPSPKITLADPPKSCGPKMSIRIVLCWAKIQAPLYPCLCSLPRERWNIGKAGSLWLKAHPGNGRWLEELTLTTLSSWNTSATQKGQVDSTVPWYYRN